MSEKQVSRKTRPFSIRLTEEERSLIQTRAGATPVPKYVRNVLLGEDAHSRRAQQVPIKDREPIARALAVLGKSGLATSLQSMALMAATGVLYVDRETEAYLRRACEDVREVRDLLMGALGKPPSEPVSAEVAFRKALKSFARARSTED